MFQINPKVEEEAVLSNQDLKQNILKFLLASKYVNSLYQISGQFDLLADCIFRDMNELCSFLEELEEFDINKKEVHHVINEIKREEFLGV